MNGIVTSAMSEIRELRRMAGLKQREFAVLFEAPVSGGPQGAREGSMTILLDGPATTDAETSCWPTSRGASSGCSPTDSRLW